VTVGVFKKRGAYWIDFYVIGHRKWVCIGPNRGEAYERRSTRNEYVAAKICRPSTLSLHEYAGATEYHCKSLIILEPTGGIEPPTY